MKKAKTYRVTDGFCPNNLPPIRVAIFDKGGECYDIVEIPNPAANFAKHLQTFNPGDVVRVLPDEAEGGAA